MSYRVRVRPSAQRDLKGLKRTNCPDLDRIDAAILALRDDPRPQGVVKLTAQTDEYRIRVGDYRILYAIDDAIRIVAITAVLNRRDAYR